MIVVEIHLHDVGDRRPVILQPLLRDEIEDFLPFLPGKFISGAPLRPGDLLEVTARFRRADLRRGEKTVLVAGNFQGEPQDMRLPGKLKTLLLNNLETLDTDGGTLRLAPWQLVVAEV